MMMMIHSPVLLPLSGVCAMKFMSSIQAIGGGVASSVFI
jgi:hypothetical protein